MGRQGTDGDSSLKEDVPTGCTNPGISELGRRAWSSPKSLSPFTKGPGIGTYTSWGRAALIWDLYGKERRGQSGAARTCTRCQRARARGSSQARAPSGVRSVPI